MNKLEEVYVCNDYADEDIPDVDTSEYLTMNEKPAAELSVPPSPCPVPPPDDVMRPGSLCPSQGPSNLPRRGRWTPPPVNVTQLMNLAGALDIAAAISAADGSGLLSAPASTGTLPTRIL